MQLTERFKLRKIEPGDFFLPNDLNGGTDQMEEALRIAHAGAVEEHDQRTGETAALDQRVTALEVHKMVAGSYIGNHTIQTIDLGFTPAAVLVMRKNFYDLEICALAITGSPALGYGSGEEMYIVPNGFTVGYPTGAAGLRLNTKNYEYHYIAFL